MICQLCGRKIGPFRRFVDREFCCAAHRHEARSCLDSTLADIDDGLDDGWSTSRSRRRGSSSQSAQTASVLLLVVAAVLVLATVSFSGGGGGGGSTNFVGLGTSTRPSDTGSGWMGGFGSSVSRVVSSRSPVTLHEDFHSGLNEWISAGAETLRAANNGEWSFTAEGLRPGRLKIWKRSTALANYELDFVGQIDRKSMGWAYRALDAGNYYGTKLTILKNGPGPNAGLIRYVMLNGREVDRVQLPLPISLAVGEPYRIKVRVRNDRFVTSVNGQVVSSWSDQRLHRGGVGFFSDEGESSTVKWVSLSERDSLLGRVLAYFSLIRIPLPFEDE